jgi:SWI/SNF-related matrix-associated actin-dependent regulator 1 of chromatin subfamily A
MRPYANPSDIRGKLRKRKGVSGNLFDNYVDLMHSYGQTDDCLSSCKEIGKELENILSIWTGGRHVEATESMRPSAEPEDVKAAIKIEDGQVKTEEAKPEAVETVNGSLAVPSAGPSRLGTPTLGAESSANVGAALIEISEAVLQQSRNQDASEEVKKAFEGYLYEQPKMLEEGVKLKNYQLLGVNWLKLLYEKNISCILADEMGKSRVSHSSIELTDVNVALGLGKTIQVIAFLAHLKETEKPGPHLVVVPSSTLDNWIREFEKFAPSLKVYAYYGTQAERVDARYFLKQEKDLDVLVTTYNMATGAADDRKFLKKMEFKVCVFDEGHQLKNAESKKYKDLMELKVGWRLLLTGTPLQNNLQELVSLLSFILPKIFSDAQDSLRAIFKVPPDAHKNLLTRQRVRHAKQVMTPFVLRRKKAQVLRDLPPKTELVEYCEMSEKQRDIYRETLEKHRKAVVEYAPSGTSTPADGSKPPPKKRGRANVKSGKQVQENSTSNVLMALRKAANHPMLFRRLYDDKLIKQMAKECLKEEEFADRNVDYM